ncbi:TonB-dependent receptor [Glacieibacterium megasporae]|uniref:TonB-dependent receptor n=1 Tax=Glacieibacterium megasporae TaxID=2835787 RepID=UPI001C1E1230|nr:TonB-dependent receptor [Polymorphobacter megasporae]UAJ08975.1 TonB-dependent receptor [Polymorphobacter megasporae]
MGLVALKASLLAASLVLPTIAAAEDIAAVDGSSTGDIVITAKRLDNARDAILPSLGASKYTFDRAAIVTQPQGQDRSLTGLLLQAPGVVQDSYGQLHVRNEHANVQYRINGVIVPESITGFGQTIDIRLADSISLLTGTLPAQYGYRTSGVINITTQTGAFDNGGDVGFYGGSRGTIEPSASIKGSSGGFNYFASASYLKNDLGIENPTSTRDAIHDRTDQFRGFAYVSQILSETSRLSAFGGAATGRFQIPNNPGQDPAFAVNRVSDFNSSLLNQNQHEYTYYGVLAYQYSADALSVQVAPFARYSRTTFTPDPSNGDIIFNGFSDRSRLSSLAYGVQTDASYKLSDRHTLRGGFFFQNERTRSSVTSLVLSTDGDGNQASDVPFPVTVPDRKNGQLYGVYLQDEWSITPQLTLNVGARFDAVHAFTTENQLSPRINLVYEPSKGTTFHAGYARDFTPPPQELIGTSTVAIFNGTTKQSEIQTADAVKAEREHYFDAGVVHTVLPGLTVGLDGYYKIKRNLLDEGQFGEAVVLSPFNYERGWAWGIELTTAYKSGPLSLYGNATRGQEKGRNIVSSQFFFAPDELAYIATHPINTDHSQRWTASGGASYAFDDGIGHLTPTADFIYGDGLRADDAAGIVPNGGKLPSYVQVNLGIEQAIDGPGVLKGLSVRFDVINVGDKSYAIRDGSGVGVGAPQFGQRRGFFGGIRKTF